MRFLRFLLHTSSEGRELLLASAFVGAVSGLSSVVLLAIIHRSLGPSASSASRVFALFVGLCLLVTVTRIASSYFLASLAQATVVQLRLDLVRRILSTPLGTLEAHGAHRLYATLTDDINALVAALIQLPAIVINLTVVGGCLIYLGYLNSTLLLYLLVLVVVGAVSYQVPMVMGARRFRKAREIFDELISQYRGLTEGIKELKLHRARRSAFISMTESIVVKLRGLRVGAAVIFGTATAWGSLLFFMLVGAMVFVRPAWVDPDPQVLTGYVLTLLYMLGPLQTGLMALQQFARADVALKKVERLGFMLGKLEPIGPPKELAATHRFTGLELVDVQHTYLRDGKGKEPERWKMGPMSFRVDPGEILFIVGGNGSGKTTLAKIVVGLYDPEGGEIRINDEVVAPEQGEDFRELFSVVFSDFYVFDRLLGMEEDPSLEEAANRYLKELKIDHKVKVEDGRLSTTDLSLGQRKRLALLTAYLENRPIYLFDEWAADQDPVFKEVFYRQILPELRGRGKAVVVISHDDRYFDEADRILKLEDGQLVMDGDWEAYQKMAVAALR